MWIGTAKGLALFDGFTLAAVWPDGVNPSPFLSNSINDIALVGDSTYVATKDGVYVTKSDEGVVWQRRVQGLIGRFATSITGFGTQIWCVSGNRLYRGGETGVWTLWENGLAGASAYTVRSHGSKMMVGTNFGILEYDGVSTWQPMGPYPSYPANAWVEIDPTGQEWAGSSEGLWFWTGTAWTLRTSAGPRGNWVQGMALKGHTLYISTRDVGIARFDGSGWRTFAPGPGATPDTTFLGTGFNFALMVDRGGSVWAAQWGQSLARIDDSSEPPQFMHYYDTSEGAFDERNTFGWSSGEDPSGNRWFGYDTRLLGVITPIGINRIATDDTRTNFSPQNGAAMSANQVRAIAFAPGPSFEMWVGYAQLGIDIFTDPTLATRAARIDTLNNNDLWGLAFNGDSVWIATANGLTRYSRATRLERENIGTQPPSSQGSVHPLSIDSEGGVWWATQGGVFHRRPDRSVEVFTADNSPLLSNDVHSVIVDRSTGDVWIGSVQGVNRYNPNASSGGGGGPVSGSSFGVYPNPAFLSSAGTAIRTVNLSGPFKGRVFDVRGRIVKHLLGNASSGVLWDATYESGQRAAPGLYFFEVENAGVTRRSRVILIR
jgi:ligand-binding sensor domain-containing protein